MRDSNGARLARVLAAACVAFVGVLVAPAAVARAAGTPSAHCHITDGTFSTCPDGSREWSDVTPQAFPERHAWLYADQATLTTGGTRPDTFMLLYDECGRTTALGPDEYFLVNFDTVEADTGTEQLERYSIHVFADGTIIWIKNGVAQADATGHFRVQTIDGQRGKAGFGTSPNCSFNHLIVEFQIELTVAGGHSYSPDPIFWGGTEPPCSVNITRDSAGTEPINVGTLAQYSAHVSGGGTPVAYQWSVDGPVLKDYKEAATAPFSTVPMQASDFQNQNIALYWQPLASQVDPNPGTAAERKVTVTVTAGNQTCTADLTTSVERNTTDSTKVAEHWYTSNHTNFANNEHANWHAVHHFLNTDYDGAMFFEFHRAIIANFNAWRATFGYPPVGPSWDPGTPIPTGPGIDHAGRTQTVSSLPKPSEFTTTGTTPRASNGDPCELNDPTNPSSGVFSPAPKKLQDFPANQKLLGCAVTDPWHNRVHTLRVGGDMSNPATTEQDPLFWRWHKFVDDISVQRSGFTPGSRTR